MSYCLKSKLVTNKYLAGLLRISFISLISFLQLQLILCQNGLNNVTDDCINKCNEKNQTIIVDSINIECENDCYIKQCYMGCSLWEQALNSSCQTVCNVTDDEPKFIYCTMSCNDALSCYFKWIHNEIGTLPAPFLLSETLSTTTLKLEWKIPKKLEILNDQKSYLMKSYLVQWRYEDDVNDNDWKIYRNQSFNYNDSIVQINNLLPYKKYRFRVVVPLSSNLDEILMSEESDILTTLASGVPLSKPVIVRAVAVDHTRIFISWQPGSYINGPILSYSLKLKILPSESLAAFKEIQATENTNYYLFEKLSPSKNYSIEISMNNTIGNSPQAKIVIETPPIPTINENEPELRFILGSEYSIVSQGSDFLFDPPNEFYKSIDRIMGIAIHISKSLIFVSDEVGYIYKAPLELNQKNTSKRKESILTPKFDGSINLIPSLLSLDWLNDHLYILVEIDEKNSKKHYQIIRCNLNGKNLIVAITGLYKKPSYLQVDPLNGYLYWTICGNTENDGLFRLDLGDISNDIKPDFKQLIKGGDLSVFIIDYLKYKIMIPSNRTIYSISLDGKFKENIRNNTKSLKLNSIKSITTSNNLFYWTNGNDLFTEIYDIDENLYYHNQYSSNITNTIFYISVLSSSLQPLPIPLNPPCNLQVLLSSSKAKIIWNRPDLLSNQGKGAWQDWYYELKIIDDSNVNNVIRDIKGTYFTVDRLIPNTNYTFLALAYTGNGRSPYSNEFKSKTLKSNHDRYIIWSSSVNGLLQSDIIGENIKELISKNELNNYDIIDLTWFEDIIYFVSNSSIKYYNRTSNLLGQLNVINESVDSIEIDWIGKKIYWSILSQNYITRSNLNGLDKEYLPIIGFVKEFKIDSLYGHIYYSTGSTLNACRLNGKNHMNYVNFEPYSNQIMGLTLDMDQEKLYWIVRNNNNSSILYSAPIAQYWHIKMIPIQIQLLNQTISQSSPLILNRLTHFSDRLIWLQNDHTVLVSDNKGKNIAYIKSDKLNGLKTISVIDPMHHILPKDLTIINVIPESINNDTIKFTGTWKSFNITWEPIRTVTYGEIFYEIRIRQIQFELLKVETSMPHFLYTNHSLSPYTLLDITIRPFTYWGSGKTSITQLYSPVGPPSEPTKPIVFISHQYEPFRRNGINISAIFRWNDPEKLNGPKVNYKISCWYKYSDGHDKIIFNDFNRDSSQEIIITNLLQNITYNFQCQSFSIINENGPKSNIISVNSSHENQIPKLLLSTKSNQILEIDMNLNQTKILIENVNSTEHLIYIENEKKLFWINENHELILYTINENVSNKSKIAIINGTIISLTIDWIQRIIYWVQYDNDQNNVNSIIYRLDLNRYNGEIMIGEKYLSSTEFIKDLIISPINQQLYWIQYPDRNTKYGNLMQYSINLDMEIELPNNIDCLNDTFQRILFDTTSDIENRLILVSSTTESIFSFGLQSLNCELLQIRYDNLTKNIAKDNGHIYLLRNDTISAYNSQQILQYSMNISSIKVILAYYHQNYPHKLCLLPRKNISITNYIPELIKNTENSILIQLPQIETYSNCTLKLPGIKYYIEYSEQFENDSFSTLLISYNSITEISNLNPFTKYNLRIGITNFYAQQIGLKILYGPIVTLSTAPGAPSIPRNLTGETISPNEIIVKWLKPEKLNNDKIWYLVYWQIKFPFIEFANKNCIKVLPDDNLIENLLDEVSISLTDLLPNVKYLIWIEAYSTNLTFSKSVTIEIETFPEPDNITIIEKTANSLCLRWREPNNIQKFIFQYSIFNSSGSDIQKIIIDSENDTRFDKDFNENYNRNLTDNEIYLIDNLQPKTTYNFSFQLFYTNQEIPYIWPHDNRFLFETLGDCPSPPGKPQIHHINDDVYKISWYPAKENGATIEEYSLEGLQSRVTNRIKRSIIEDDKEIDQFENTSVISIIEPLHIIDNNTSLLNQMQSVEEPDEFHENWLILYNGKENYCIKYDINLMNPMIFRVRARNLYGWSLYSIESEPISEPYISIRNRDSLIIAIFAPIIIIGICFILGGCMIFVLRKRSTSKKNFDHQRNSQMPSNVELTNLRELSCNSANIIYGPLTDSDIALLPQIRRNQIKMSSFLGSGAFGEVYEGLVRYDHNNSEIRVAIKTLRKGAIEQEKIEFLQEAQLMSNFKHKHILQLIGICFDIDSLFIIMELMEGGDLLTYLRQSRPHMGVPLTLTLDDLISICVDVASGCRYLEEMHFVHRDLACRNCLVSSIDRELRIVKIGDFGLARDIYKNDYYRKEGEGLLPVRWMSPESLVDGVFTSQSDMWAFGVLCWEIMTLGQQPYPARNNFEVLHYVRDGGRLGRPDECPDGLYNLMLNCWSYRPDERPTFRYCLEILNLLQTNPNEIIHIEDYQSDDNKSLVINKLKLNNELLIEPPIILTPTSSTTSIIKSKYVDILYDDGNCGDEEDNQTTNNDYEIPIANIRDQKSIECDTETPTIVNFDVQSSSERKSLCSNNSITNPIELEANCSQDDCNLSISGSENTEIPKVQNLTMENTRIINNSNSNLNIIINNLGYCNCNNDNTDKKISPNDNLSSENNCDDNSSSNYVQYESTDDVSTKL